MINEPAIELSQTIPFGRLKFTPSREELAILKLISCGKDEAILHWQQLWSQTDDYDDLLFSCKELMPSAVKKIQTSCAEGQWQQFIPKNAEFLAGLPKYTWTKNQYIINHYQQIAAALDKEHIEFLALKGVCEMLDGNTLAFMRTSRDIDLLIHEEDWEKFTQIVEKLGWVNSKNITSKAYLNSPIKSHAEVFQQPEGIFDLDVHFVVIPGPKSDSEKFTKSLWARKVKSKKYLNCYIPSPEDRYIITVANAFNLHNWKQGHITKYLHDMLTISCQMDHQQFQEIVANTESVKNIGHLIGQANAFANHIRGIDLDPGTSKQYRINVSVNQNFLIHFLRLLLIIQLFDLLTKGRQILQVFTYFISRVISRFMIILKTYSSSKSSRHAQKNKSKVDLQNRFWIQLLPR